MITWVGNIYNRVPSFLPCHSGDIDYIAVVISTHVHRCVQLK